MNIRLCIITPKVTYSQTFIKTHINKIKYVEDVIFLHELKSIKKNSLFPNRITEILYKLIKRVSNQVSQYILAFYISNYCKRNGLNIILAEHGQYGGIIGYKVLKFSNIKLIVHFHGGDAFGVNWIKKYNKEYKDLFRTANKIISVSQPMTEQLIKLGANKNKITNITYGISKDFYDQNKNKVEEPIFLFVGRLTAKKAPSKLLKAFSLVLKEISDAKLIIIGDGELKENCITLIKSLKLNDNIKLLGEKSPEEIILNMLSALAYVQHSIISPDGDSEGTPVSIIEASGIGLPVVSTYHAGIPEVISHNETGYLVEEGDVSGMANYMIKLAKDPVLAFDMGKKGKERILKYYTEEISISKLEKVIENINISSEDA